MTFSNAGLGAGVALVLALGVGLGLAAPRVFQDEGHGRGDWVALGQDGGQRGHSGFARGGDDDGAWGEHEDDDDEDEGDEHGGTGPVSPVTPQGAPVSPPANGLFAPQSTTPGN